jgi:hypothetical protein
MQYSQDHLSALLHELDVTGSEYRTAVQALGRTIARGKDIRASDPAFLAANQTANLAQQRYRRALDAYKEHFRVEPDGSVPSSDAPTTLTLH